MRTFVLRVFVPADGNGVALCGIVEHVGTGRAEPFHGARGLIDAVLDELGRDADVATESNRRDEAAQPGD